MHIFRMPASGVLVKVYKNLHVTETNELKFFWAKQAQDFTSPITKQQRQCDVCRVHFLEYPFKTND